MTQAPDDTLTADQAVARLVASIAPVETVESAPLMACLGRVLARDLVSALANPPHDNSAMDGYGIRLADLAPAGPTTLPVRLRVPAGDAPGAVLPLGEAARIFTGAPIPRGVDAVLPQEVCQAADGSVTLSGPVAAGENIRRKGDDFDVGGIVVKAGSVLRPQEIGMASAIGLIDLPVFARPKVAVFSTGNEVCDPGQPLKPGGVYDMNRYTIISLLRQAGCDPVDLGILPDDRQAIMAALQDAASRADVIMTSGGVSVGEEDHVKPAVEALGAIDFWKVSIRPGRPIAFGHVAGTPFMGLPGNPVSSMVCFMVFARPFLARLSGRAHTALPMISVPAAFKFKKRAGRREWVRGWLEDGRAHGYPNQSSGVLSSMVAAKGLIDVAEESEGFEPGDMVRFVSFAELWQ